MSKARDLAGVLGGNAVLNIGDVSGLQTALDAKAPAGSYAPLIHDHNDLYPTDAEVASAINSAVAGKISVDTNTVPNATNYAIGHYLYVQYLSPESFPDIYELNGLVTVWGHSNGSFVARQVGRPQPFSGYSIIPGTWRVRSFAAQRVA